MFATFMLLVLYSTQTSANSNLAFTTPSGLTSSFDCYGVKWLSGNNALTIGIGGSGGIVLRTTDAGQTWLNVSTTKFVGGLLGLDCRSVSSVYYCYAVDELGSVYVSSTADTSSHPSWTKTSLISSFLFGVSIDSTGIVYIAGDSAVMRSSISATSWVDISPANPTSNVYFSIR
jgi:photosystem II stability/assembly factor-like uncharacterized protein